MTASQPTASSPAEAVARLARVWAAGQNEREDEARRGGTEAVAEWACPDGTDGERASVAAYWEQLSGTSAA